MCSNQISWGGGRFEIAKYTVNLGPWPVITEVAVDSRLATIASVLKRMVPGTIEEVGGNWIYQTDDYAEADAVSISVRQTVIQYFPEGGDLPELLQAAVVITEEDPEEGLEGID